VRKSQTANYAAIYENAAQSVMSQSQSELVTWQWSQEQVLNDITFFFLRVQIFQTLIHILSVQIT